MATYKMTLDFFGKDNVHFAHEYEIPEEIYNLIQNLKSGKKEGDKVFSVSSSDIGNFMISFFGFMWYSVLSLTI